jgi:hypothetical protein
MAKKTLLSYRKYDEGFKDENPKKSHNFMVLALLTLYRVSECS